jgi:stage V sporulation protein SpoVS
MTSASARRHFTAAAVLLLLRFAAGTLVVQAAEMMDTERQGDLFKRIFSYDKDLRGSEKIVVIVVSETKTSDEVGKVAAVFRQKGMFPAVVTVSELTDDLTATLTAQSTVVYVMPGVAYDAVKTFAAAKGFLSISGVPTLAEAGYVSVSVKVAGDRPEIVVNMARLQTEHHELSSELLNLARVIR